MLEKNFILLSLLIPILILVAPASAEDGSDNKLKLEIAKMERALNGEYPFVAIINGEEKQLYHEVQLSNCRMLLRTSNENGVVFQDRYKLTELYPQKNSAKIKGAFAISFGIIPVLTKRSKMYFDTLEERALFFNKLQDLTNLCHVHWAKAYYNHLNFDLYKEKESQEVFYDGYIPIIDDPVAGKIHHHEDNNFLALLDGKLSFYERYHSLINATKSILVQCLLFRGDASGIFFSKLFMQKRLEGLQVEVIIDAFAALGKDNGETVSKNSFRLYHNLMAAGIRVWGYSCGDHLLRNELRGLDFIKLIRRSHEKLWVIDGEFADGALTTEQPGTSSNISSSVAIVGGMNMSQDFFQLSNSDEGIWRDQDVALRGSLVHDVYEVFNRNFESFSFNYKSYARDYDCFNPFDPLKERQAYLQFKTEHTIAYLNFTGKDAVLMQDARTSMELFKKGFLGKKDAMGNPIKSVPLYTKITRGRLLRDKTEELQRYIYQTYINMINNAKKEILIANAYFVPPLKLRNAIVSAAKRGVQVKIITSSLNRKNLPLMTITGRYFYLDLVRGNNALASVNIYEWTGLHNRDEVEDKVNDEDLDRLEETVTKIEKDEDDLLKEGSIHAKYMVIDGTAGIIGSFNLNSSSRKNSESAIVFESDELGKKLASAFIDDLKLTNPISIEKMKQYHNPPMGKYKLLLLLGKRIKNFL
ncbi:MAG: phosphatidylserine/phosphatidylglycerophosphate/cardiolipin synthase family protein [Oligoflexia bacterium]|nr:phosphatidylserine/phosphatidylglycerophosphate/cardiolipin synthase family protein [Oligoflexia bacterium]